MAALVLCSFLAAETGCAEAWVREQLPAIPDSVAIVEDAWQAPGSGSDSGRTIILIQDAHTNNSGQLNVAKTLDILLKKEPIRYVFTEAGSGDLSLSFLRKYADKSGRKRIAESFLSRGKLQGSEYLDLISGHDFILWGVEDQGLYAQSVEIYKRMASSRAGFRNYLNRMDVTSRVLKTRIYNARLLAFDAKREEFISGKSSFTGYFEALKEEAERLGMALDDYPHLRALNAPQDLESKPDVKLIWIEKNRLEDEVLKVLAASENERELARAAKNISILKSLSNLSLTPDEFREYKLDKSGHDMARLTGFLNRMLIDLQADYDRAIFLDAGHEEIIRQCESFYDLTLKRDQEFVQNALAKMRETNETKAVLVTGGYHTPNLKVLLQRAGISFVSITPRILHETDQKRYERLLLEQSGGFVEPRGANAARGPSTNMLWQTWMRYIAGMRTDVNDLVRSFPEDAADRIWREMEIERQARFGRSNAVPATGARLVRSAENVRSERRWPEFSWHQGAFSIYGRDWLLRVRLWKTHAIEELGLVQRVRLGPLNISFYRGPFTKPSKTEDDVYVLGISGSWHDSTAVLLKNGRLIAAIEEERMTRVKHDASQFPMNATLRLLEEHHLSLSDIDHIALAWDYNRNQDTPLSRAPSRDFFEKMDRGYAQQSGIKPSQIIKRNVYERNKARHNPAAAVDFVRQLRAATNSDASPPLSFVPHHWAHAASTYYASGFDEPTLIVTVDGYGDQESASVWVGRGTEMKNIRSFQIPDSLGWAYITITEYLGFKPNSAEGEVMGLASYGAPQGEAESDRVELLRAFMRKFIRIDAETGAFSLDPEYVYYGPMSEGKTRITEKLIRDLGPIVSLSDASGEDMALRSARDRELANLAYCLQERVEEALLNLVEYHLKKDPRTRGLAHVALAGGVALNINANTRLLREGLVAPDKLFVYPAAGDPGTAIGAAQVISESVYGKDPMSRMDDAGFGLEYSDQEIEDILKRFGLQETVDYIRFAGDEELVSRVSDELANGKVVAWFQGRSEIGPRALGHRSLLLNAADPTSNHRANVAKKRQWWRPSAISLTQESANKILTIRTTGGKELALPGVDAPFMNMAYDVATEHADRIVSGRHLADGSTRPQTVARDQDPLYHALLDAMGRKTGEPALINTSLNQKEPLVEDPEEALNTFWQMEGADYLSIGHFLVLNKKFTPSIRTLSNETNARRLMKEAAASGDITIWDRAFEDLRRTDELTPAALHRRITAVLKNDRGEERVLQWPLVKEAFVDSDAMMEYLSAAIHNQALDHGATAILLGSDSPKYNRILYHLLAPRVSNFTKLARFVNRGREIRVGLLNQALDEPRASNRPQTIYRPEPNDVRGWSIGVDVGATFIKTGLVKDGVILWEEKTYTPGMSGQALAAHLRQQVARAHERFTALKKDGADNLAAIGIDWPGVVDMVPGRSGEVLWLVDLEPWWKAQNPEDRKIHYAALNSLPGEMRDAYGAPVYMINDAKAFGVAEMLLSPERFAKNSRTTVAALGTGVGEVTVQRGDSGPFIDFNYPHQISVAVVDLGSGALGEHNRGTPGALSDYLSSGHWAALEKEASLGAVSKSLSDPESREYAVAAGIVARQAEWLARWAAHYAFSSKIREFVLTGGLSAGEIGPRLADETNKILSARYPGLDVRVSLSRLDKSSGGILGSALFALGMSRQSNGARLAAPEKESRIRFKRFLAGIARSSAPGLAGAEGARLAVLSPRGAVRIFRVRSGDGALSTVMESPASTRGSEMISLSRAEIKKLNRASQSKGRAHANYEAQRRGLQTVQDMENEARAFLEKSPELLEDLVRTDTILDTGRHFSNLNAPEHRDEYQRQVDVMVLSLDYLNRMVSKGRAGVNRIFLSNLDSLSEANQAYLRQALKKRPEAFMEYAPGLPDRSRMLFKAGEDPGTWDRIQKDGHIHFGLEMAREGHLTGWTHLFFATQLSARKLDDYFSPATGMVLYEENRPGIIRAFRGDQRFVDIFGAGFNPSEFVDGAFGPNRNFFRKYTFGLKPILNYSIEIYSAMVRALKQSA